MNNVLKTSFICNHNDINQVSVADPGFEGGGGWAKICSITILKEI